MRYHRQDTYKVLFVNIFTAQCSKAPTKQNVPFTMISILSRIRSTRMLYTRYLLRRGPQCLQLPFLMIMPSHLWPPVLLSPGRKRYRPGTNMPSLENFLPFSRVLVLSKLREYCTHMQQRLYAVNRCFAYLDKTTNVVEWEPISQHCLHKDAKRKYMYPDHDRLTPASPAKPQCFAPDFPFVLTHALDLLLLFFSAAFNVLVIAGCPFHFPTLVHKFSAMFFECGDCKKGKLFIMCDFKS